MQNIIRALCGTLGIILTGISIIASCGYILNESNQTQNKQIQSSTSYKQLEEGKSIQKELFATKKAEIERLQELQKMQQQEGQKAVDSLPRDYITAKQQARTKTATATAKSQEQINAIQSEISNISKDLQRPIDLKNVNFKSENGYIALFDMLANSLNKTESFKDEPTTGDRLLTFFIMFISAVFEVLAVTLYIIQRKVLSIIAFVISFCFTLFLMVSMSVGIIACVLAGGMAFVMDCSKCIMLKLSVDGVNLGILESLGGTKLQSESILPTTKPSRFKGMFKPKSLGVTAKADKNQIGFKANVPSSDDFNNADIERYKKYMYETQKDNISKGYIHISKSIGVPSEVGRKIKGYLENNGIVKTDGAKTIILK